METDQREGENEVAAEAETTEDAEHRRLLRYADYDAFTFYHTESASEFPSGPVQVTVRGRVCGTLTLDWDAIEDVLSYMLNRPVGTLSPEEKERLSRAAAEEAVWHVLEFLPQKIDTALEQLCWEAAIGLFNRRSVVRRIRLPSLAQTVESIVRSEEEAIKARLGVHRGAPKGERPEGRTFRRGEFRAELKEVVRQLARGDDPVTRASVARRLGIEIRTFDRLCRRHFQGKGWRDLVAEIPEN